jgi:hypothetical protein
MTPLRIVTKFHGHEKETNAYFLLGVPFCVWLAAPKGYPMVHIVLVIADGKVQKVSTRLRLDCFLRFFSSFASAFARARASTFLLTKNKQTNKQTRNSNLL